MSEGFAWAPRIERHFALDACMEWACRSPGQCRSPEYRRPPLERVESWYSPHGNTTGHLMRPQHGCSQSKSTCRPWSMRCTAWRNVGTTAKVGVAKRRGTFTKSDIDRG